MTELFGSLILFLLVVAGFAIAGYWAMRKEKPKLVLLVAGVFMAWLVLPSVFHWVRSEMKSGVYRKYGTAMGGRLERRLRAIGRSEMQAATKFVAETCGDAEGYDGEDPTLQTVSMPEMEMVEHFFYYGKYSDVIWLGVGWKDRFCLARYLQTERYTGFFFPLPSQLFPYPLLTWRDATSSVETQLIERLPPPPKAPEGVRALLPGQCAFGNIARGDTQRFQVQVPYFQQTIGLKVELPCVDTTKYSGVVEWTKDGRPIVGLFDESESGGTYQITLRAPATRVQPYAVGVYWGDLRCSLPIGWWIDCGPPPDPDR